MSAFRFAAVSDIHGNVPALEQVMADITRRGITSVVDLGDHASGPLWPRETIDLLMGTDWIHIAGNHDRILAHDAPASLGLSDAHARKHLDAPHLDWLRSLPPTVTWQNDILLCHGTPASDMAYLADTIAHGRLRRATPGELVARIGGIRAKVILCGHSHTPRIVHAASGTVVINPGSVGLQAYQDSSEPPHVVECGSPHARYAVVTIDGASCSVDHIALPYDHTTAVKQAKKNARPEWAVGLATGYMTAAADG